MTPVSWCLVSISVLAHCHCDGDCMIEESYRNPDGRFSAFSQWVIEIWEAGDVVLVKGGSLGRC